MNRWWVINESVLFEALERCWNDEDPNIVMTELLANSRLDEVE